MYLRLFEFIMWKRLKVVSFRWIILIVKKLWNLFFILYVYLKYFDFEVVKVDNGFKFLGGVRWIYMR